MRIVNNRKIIKTNKFNKFKNAHKLYIKIFNENVKFAFYQR